MTPPRRGRRNRRPSDADPDQAPLSPAGGDDPEPDLSSHNEELVEQIVTIVQRRVEMQFRYTGPLPWSGELNNYDEVVPGAADRIIAMTE